MGLKLEIICSIVFTFLKIDSRPGKPKLVCKSHLLISRVKSELFFRHCFIFCLFSFFCPYDFSTISCHNQKLKCHSTTMKAI